QKRQRGSRTPHDLQWRKLRRELQGQAGEANADRMGFVADVQTDQQGRYGFDDAGVFEFAAVYSAGTWKFLCQFGCHSLCQVVVAADEDVAIDRASLREQFRAHVVKRGCDGHRLGDKFTGQDRKSTRLNSSHVSISYAVFCLKKKMMSREFITRNA